MRYFYYLKLSLMKKNQIDKVQHQLFFFQIILFTFNIFDLLNKPCTSLILYNEMAFKLIKYHLN